MILALNILLWLILILVIVFLITLVVSYKSFAPWVPIKKKDIARVFKLAELKPGQVFYDLGCGDGRLVVAANKKFGTKSIGLEISLLMFTICKIRQLFNKNKNIIFKYKNLFKENLSQADVIYFFGIPTNLKNNRIGEKLKQELKPGAKVISYSFSIPGWQPTLVDQPKEKDALIFLYQI